MKGVVFTSRGGACPYQAEGTIDGAAFYFRARGGVSLDVGGDPIMGGTWAIDLTEWAARRWSLDYFGYLTDEQADQCMIKGFELWRNGVRLLP